MDYSDDSSDELDYIDYPDSEELPDYCDKDEDNGEYSNNGEHDVDDYIWDIFGPNNDDSDDPCDFMG